MNDTGLAVIIAALSVVPLPLIYRYIRSNSPMWLGIVVGLGSAALAVGFFWVWKWSQHLLLAYVDAIMYGSLALLAPLVAINGRLMPNRHEPRPPAANP